MKYTFVGDIHGKIDVVNRALDEDGKIVFVGDLVDSLFSSVQDQIKCVETVLKAVDAGKARCIFGNHELSYLMPNIHRCSGYKKPLENALVPLVSEMLAKFEPYIEIDGGDDNNWLITHAGLRREVLAHHDKWLDEDRNRTTFDWYRDTTTAAHWIGARRGGRNTVGGIFWCDFNSEFGNGVDCFNQIFGHTASGGAEGIRTRHTKDTYNYCIDCLDKKVEFLKLDI